MEFKQVQYFLEITKTGSFSAAAAELHISQSSLSKQVIALEQELGCTLIDRSHRRITLTDAGQVFYQHAVTLNNQHKALLSDLTAFSAPPALSIASIPVIAQYGITSFIARFRENYPNIHFVLEEREAADILPALRNEQYDLAFMRDYQLDREQIGTVEIYQDHMTALVSRRHPLPQRELVSLAELSNENFIMFDRGTAVHEISMDACRKAGFEPSVFYASLRVESILSLVATNIGIALMMQRISAYHHHPDLVMIPLQEVITSNLVLAYLKNKKQSLSARLFVDLVQEQKLPA